MVTYGFRFRIPGIEPDDERLDLATEHVEALVASSHGGLTVLDVAVESSNAVCAGTIAARALLHAGLAPERTVPDLVDRTEIAARVGVTRQAVGNWVRGNRHSASPFPAPYTVASGELWLWGDAAQWLCDQGLFDDEFSYPSWSDHTKVDHWILSHIHRAEFADGSGWVPAGDTVETAVTWRTPTSGSASRDFAADTYQYHFGLAS